MGRRKGKNKKHRKSEKYTTNPSNDFEEDFDPIDDKRNVKERSKHTKKWRSKQKTQEKYGNEKNANWKKITVTVKSNVEKMFVLKSIGNCVEKKFCPLGYHKNETENIFFLENDAEVIEAIQSLDKRLKSDDGQIMSISVKNVRDQELPLLNNSEREILKEFIINQYISSAGLLNLQGIYCAEPLIQKDLFAVLNNKTIMLQVLGIVAEIAEKIGEIKFLDISYNKLTNFEKNCGFSLLNEIPLKIVHSIAAVNLEGNNLTNLKVLLDCLQKFPNLCELKIASNPVEKMIKSTKTHLNTLKRMLPNLKILDGEDLNSYWNSVYPSNLKPSLLECATKVPSDSNIAIEEFKCKMSKFLDDYFKIFDADQRFDLQYAYKCDSQVTFSSNFHIEIPKIISSEKIIFEGQSNILEFLNALPKTKHLVHKLTTLKSTASSGIAEISGECQISGWFGDRTINFYRIMNIVTYNNGLCCKLDNIEMKI